MGNSRFTIIATPTGPSGPCRGRCVSALNTFKVDLNPIANKCLGRWNLIRNRAPARRRDAILQRGAAQRPGLLADANMPVAMTPPESQAVPMVSEELKRELLTGDATPEAVGRRLRLLRASLGLTQAKMSALMDASIKNYQHMERGSTYPRPAHVKAMFESARIDFNFVYYGDFTRLPLDVSDSMQSHVTDQKPAKSA